jgi:uncharacterized protein YjbI with pentapeptide repeats
MARKERVPFFVCLVLAVIALETRSEPVAAFTGVPVITSATADLDAGTLTLVGQQFVSSPLPRVHMGADAGGFRELVVDSATSTSIVARLLSTTPGTYRVVVLFGRTGLLVGAMDVTIGAVGRTGEKGEKGEKGDTGEPGAGFDLAVTDARYARVVGDNHYSGNQNVQGAVNVHGSIGVLQSVSAARFIGDGSGLTNVGFARLGGPCVMSHTADTDPEPDAIGVIVGFDGLGNADCRALVGTECKLLPILGGPSRELRGRELHRQSSNDAIPVDASNCTVPDGGPVHVRGPRPNLSGARIRNVSVTPGGDWSFADLNRADLWLEGGGNLSGANLRGATIETAGGHDMSAADATGLVFTRGLVAQLIADDATLAGARLRIIEAPGSSFKRANLRMASFSSGGPSRLLGASFLDADLFRANLSGADCRTMGLIAGCDFTRAKLRETNLQGLQCGAGQTALACNFTLADLTGANLTGATLASAVLDRVIWSNTTCPDGTNSDLADGDESTCLSNLQLGPGVAENPSSILGTYVVTLFEPFGPVVAATLSSPAYIAVAAGDAGEAAGRRAAIAAG